MVARCSRLDDRLLSPSGNNQAMTSANTTVPATAKVATPVHWTRFTGLPLQAEMTKGDPGSACYRTRRGDQVSRNNRGYSAGKWKNQASGGEQATQQGDVVRRLDG